MVFCMSLALYTQIHVIISLVAIASGIIVAVGIIMGKRLPAMTALFLFTTVLTSVTGFFFPLHGVTPGIIVGILSLVILLIAVVALYGKHLAGGWRRTYVITAMFALYLNCFVLVAQLFEHVPSLHVLAPTGTESPFKISQGIVLLLFVVLTIIVDKKSRFSVPA
jgi:hypothetical protein